MSYLPLQAPLQTAEFAVAVSSVLLDVLESEVQIGIEPVLIVMRSAYPAFELASAVPKTRGAAGFVPLVKALYQFGGVVSGCGSAVMIAIEGVDFGEGVVGMFCRRR